MARRVLFDSHFGKAMHSAWRELVAHPPDGYEFVVSDSLWDRVFNILYTRNPLLSANLRLMAFVNRLFSPRLVKAFLDSKLRPRSDRLGVDLIFSMDHIASYDTNWVTFVSWPTALTGLNAEHLRTYKATIERHLVDDSCKRIITWSNLAKRAVIANFDADGIADKITVLPLAVESQPSAKRYDPDKVKLLFVGTSNTFQGIAAALAGTKYFFDFEGKGGREALEAFRILVPLYSNLELVMRTAVPPSVKREFARYPNVRIIDRLIPRTSLEEEFLTADIFVYPTHTMTPWSVFLEAMSYELPIVSTELYANAEIVQDGVTGLLVEPPSEVPYYWERFLVSMGSPLHNQFMETIKTPDPAFVARLTEKLSLLIENAELRREMGRKARYEVEEGRHSIRRRNEALKAILDDALSGPHRSEASA